MSVEKWLPVPDHPRWNISSYGRVRGLKHGKVMKPAIVNTYEKVFLAEARGKSFAFYIHRLVLLAFVGPCPPGMEAGHLDGNPRNNRLENLKWVTPVENAYHRKLHGTHRCGEGLSKKLTEKMIRAIRREYVQTYKNKTNCLELAAKYGVSRRNITRIISRDTWKHVE